MLVAHDGTESELDQNQDGAQDEEPAETLGFGRGGGGSGTPPTACEQCDGAGEAEKKLGQGGVEDPQFILDGGHPQSAQHTLQHHTKKGHQAEAAQPKGGRGAAGPEEAAQGGQRPDDEEDSGILTPFRGFQGGGDTCQKDQEPRPAEPWACVNAVEPECQDGGQKTDTGSHQPVRVLIKNPSHPSGEGEKEHVVAIGVGPVRHGHANPMACHQPSNASEAQGGRCGQEGHAMVAGSFDRSWHGGV